MRGLYPPPSRRNVQIGNHPLAQAEPVVQHHRAAGEIAAHLGGGDAGFALLLDRQQAALERGRPVGFMPPVDDRGQAMMIVRLVIDMRDGGENPVLPPS